MLFVLAAMSSRDGTRAQYSPSESHLRCPVREDLLDVFGGRAAGASLEETAAVQQRDDRQHPGAGA